MSIPLHQFEEVIDETILKRGLSYFKNGYVSSVEEISPGEYEAVVEGSDEYIVQLQIRNENITNYSCTCPYDMGPVCKHITAVIFYLQKEELGLESSSGKKKKIVKKVSKKKTVAEKVNDLLQEVSHDDLKQFIAEQCKMDSRFRQLFLSGFAHLSEGESIEIYKKQISAFLRKLAGSYGYIEWNETGLAGNMAFNLLSVAKKHFNNKNYRSAIYICCAVMEEMTEALQMADDSNGDIGGPIQEACDLLGVIAAVELPEEIRKYFFDYCLDTFNKKIFSGWDWHLNLLEIAFQLIKTNQEAERLLLSIHGLQSSDSEYEKEHAQEIELRVLRKTKGEEEAEKFIEQNLSNPILRRVAIEKYIQDRKYEKAIIITVDGIKANAKIKPGLAMEWHDWLLKIAVLQNDRERIIKYARILFVDSIFEKQQYYRLMKDNVESAGWNNFVEELIKELIKKDSWSVFDMVAQIYINEKWWDRLLKFLINNFSLSRIQHYEKYLARDYADELAGLYEKGILEYMQFNQGRNHYQATCNYMRKMMKLGAKEKVARLIEKFRKEYPKRKALIEELNLVGV